MVITCSWLPFLHTYKFQTWNTYT